MPALFLIAIALALLAWYFGAPHWTEARRRRIRRRPFPAAWRALLHRHVPYVRRMPADLQLQLKKHIQVFLAEKPFIGCAGLVVTDAMRVSIAAQACLLLLNRAHTTYYPRLRQILVYPGAFAVQQVHTDAHGVLQERRAVLSGESWSQGQVVLSWADTQAGAATPDDGQNVVIHEFAHQLDQESGTANGAPELAPGQEPGRWAQVLAGEYGHLQWNAEHGEPTVLNHYGATSPAEFFAVASESFFEQPAALAAQHPALFRELAHLYRVDPSSW